MYSTIHTNDKRTNIVHYSLYKLLRYTYKSIRLNVRKCRHRLSSGNRIPAYTDSSIINVIPGEPILDTVC